MFDARMRVDSIRLFVFMDTVRVTRSFLSRWRTKRTFYSICQNMLSKLSLPQSGKELKLGQGDGLTKRRTFVKLLEQTKRNPDKGSAKIINPVGFTGTDFSF